MEHRAEGAIRCELSNSQDFVTMHIQLAWQYKKKQLNRANTTQSCNWDTINWESFEAINTLFPHLHLEDKVAFIG